MCNQSRHIKHVYKEMHPAEFSKTYFKVNIFTAESGSQMN